MSLQKVKPGDPLRIPASTWNTMVDAAQDYLGRQHDQGGSGASLARSGTVLVKNSSNAVQPRFRVLAVTGVLFGPSDNLPEFKDNAVLVGGVPSTSTAGRFVVLAETLDNGRIGQAFVSGICPVQVNVTDANHQFADAATVTSYLASGATGSARILWKETGTGVKWALVNLGSGSVGTPVPASTVFPAKIVAALGWAVYTVKEQSATGPGTFADRSGASNITAYNLAELTMGPGNALAVGTVVMVLTMMDIHGTTQYAFDHPIYAKYLT